MGKARSRLKSRAGVLFFLLILLSLLFGCGVGDNGASPPSPSPPSPPPPPPPPPTPQPSFTLNLTPSSLGVNAGGEARTTVSVTGQNGFTGSVTLSVRGLPSSTYGSFTQNPISPSATSELVIRAASDATSQTVNVTIQGTSDALSDDEKLTLEIRSQTPPGPVRSTHIQTKGTLYSVVYDRVHKQVFAANPNLNQIDVFSATALAKVASVPVPTAVGIDISVDGSRLWVATSGQMIYGVDTSSLEVVERVMLPGIDALTVVGHMQPGFSGRQLVSTSNGTLLILGAGLFQWNPGNGEFKERTAELPFQPGKMARSGDGSKVLLASPDGAALYDSATDTFLLKPNLFGDFPAANPDATQFALLRGLYVVFLDNQLQEVNRLQLLCSRNLLYSADGRFLYAPEDEQQGTEIVPLPQFIVIDTQTFSVVGRVPDLNLHAWGRYGIIPQASDETGMLFGPSIGGLGFLDASQPRFLTRPFPKFQVLEPGPVNPPQGGLGSTTPVVLAGDGFRTGASVFFGSARGSNAIVTSPKEIRVDSPLSTSPGPVNVTAVFPDGWFVPAPDAFSYGPHVVTSAAVGVEAPAPAGIVLEIIGFGLFFDPSQISVKLGNQVATVLSVIPPLAGSDMFPYSLRYLYVGVSPGTPGPADLTVTTPAGTTSVAKAYRFLARVKDFPIAGTFKQILHDRWRRRVYLTNYNSGHVAVFSLDTEQFLPPILTDRNPTFMSLTPDGSRLLVTNAGDRTLSVIDPDNPSTVTNILLVEPGDSSLCCPADVVSTSTGKAFIGMTNLNVFGCDGVLRELDLATLTLKTRNETAFRCLTDNIKLESNQDGTKIFLRTGGVEFGIWDSSTDVFTVQMMEAFTLDFTAASDGNRLALDLHVYDGQGYKESTASLVGSGRLSRPGGPVFGQKLHPSGSLLYVPERNVVHVLDMAHGKLVRSYGGVSVGDWDPFGPVADRALDAMAIDETGKRVFMISKVGLQAIELDSVPLSIGHLEPAQGPASGGTLVTIRGSGFQPGTIVSFGSVPVSTTFVDENTLRVVTPGGQRGFVRVTLDNPDGERYQLDAGFKYN